MFCYKLQLRLNTSWKRPHSKIFYFIFFNYLQQMIKVDRSVHPVPGQNGSNPVDIDDRLNILHNCSKLANVIRHNFSREVEAKEKVEITEGVVLSTQNFIQSVHAPPWKKSRPEEDADKEDHLPVAGKGGLAAVNLSRHPQGMSSAFLRPNGGREPEVCQVGIEEVLVPSSEEDVVGLDVAVAIAYAVHVVKSLRDVGKNLDGDVFRQIFNLRG